MKRRKEGTLFEGQEGQILLPGEIDRIADRMMKERYGSKSKEPLPLFEALESRKETDDGRD